MKTADADAMDDVLDRLGFPAHMTSAKQIDAHLDTLSEADLDAILWPNGRR